MEKNNKYEELEISVIEFENTDVITSSECPNETPDVPMTAGHCATEVTVPLQGGTCIL